MSSTLSPTLQAERRSWHYWFEDGLPSLVTGASCLLISFSMLYPRHHSKSLFRTVLTLTAAVLYGVILIFHRQILDWLKAGITYPHTGYASPPYFVQEAEQSREIPAIQLLPANPLQQEEAMRMEVDRRNGFWLNRAIALAAALVTMFIRNPWICVAAGLLMAAAMWFGVRREPRLSWSILAGFPLICFCLAILLQGLAVGPERIVYFLAGGGIFFFFDGAVSLIRFLRRNPRPSSLPNAGQSHG
jgi:hypothetical protein